MLRFDCLIFTASTMLAAMILAPAMLRAEEARFDFENFDCWKIRRSGDTLELDRLTSAGPVPTTYSCSGRSCVSRELLEAKDGSVSEVYRHIYIPRDKTEYVSTWAMWRAGSDAPEAHSSTVYQLVQCEEMRPAQ